VQAVVLAGQVQGIPGAPSQHDAIHVDLVLDFELQMIEGLADWPLCQAGKGPLRRLDVAPAQYITQVFAGDNPTSRLRSIFAERSCLARPLRLCRESSQMV
jgi:hypothetical protein